MSARKVLTVAGTGIRQLRRDPVALFMIIALPLLITLVVGLAMGDEDVTTIGVVADDTGGYAGALVERLEDAEGLDVRDYATEESLRRGVRRGEIAAGVIVPGDYSAAVREGRSTEVVVVSGPSAAAVAVRSPVAAAVDDQAIEAHAARVAGGTFDEGLVLARRIAGETAVVAVERQVVANEELQLGFSYTAPSNLVLFVFLSSLAAAGVLVETRRLGVMRRALATPTRPAELLAGFALGRFGFALLQGVVIVAGGSFVFGVDWGDPVAATLLLVALAVVATGAATILGTMARTADQAGAIAPPVGIALGMLGGCMWPLEIVGDTMQAVGHLTPHAWAMDGWIEVIGGDGGVSDIVPELAALAVFAAVLLPIGAWRLRSTIAAA